MTRPSSDIFASEPQAGEIQAWPDFKRGFGLLFDPGSTDGVPSMEQFNGLLNYMSTIDAYLLRQGVPEWDATEEYTVGNVCSHNGKLWTALQANTNVEPGTSSANWYSPYVLQDSDVGAAQLPIGTTAQRPAGGLGKLRYNQSLGQFEGYGVAGWGKVGGGGATGGGTDEVFNLNSQTVSVNYVIPAGKNAMSAGPITINNGITVEVPDGSVWTIV